MKCEVCGFSFKEHDNKRLHRHHVRPKEHGGDDTRANLITLCPNCHSIAHILLRNALLLGTDETYDLYRKEYLIVRIHRYSGLGFREAWARLWSLWKVVWKIGVKVKWTLQRK